jgi:hypothetical protein
MVVDDEHAVAEAMWGADIHGTPKVTGQVEKGTGGFSPSIRVVWCSSGLVEQA